MNTHTHNKDRAHAQPRLVSTRPAAMITGYGLLLMAVLAIFANFVVIEKLVVADDAAATLANVAANPMLYRLGVTAFILVFLLDVVVAWGLYVMFRRVNQDLSLLAAWSRLAYTAVWGVALYHLLTILQLATAPTALGLDPPALQAQTTLAVNAFKTVWLIGLLLFAVHLLVLGYLAYRSGFMPKLLGVALLAAGLGYSIDGFAKLILPNYADYTPIFLAIVAIPAVIGEIYLALWLVMRGSKLAPEAVEGAGGAA